MPILRAYEPIGEQTPIAASGVYTPSGGSASASPAMAKRVVLGLAGCGTLLMALALSSTSGGGAALEGAIVHTGDYCKSNPKYTKDTLKPLLDRPVASLLRSKDLKGLRKFEASDVMVKDGFFYSVMDSSWAIVKVSEDMPVLSGAHGHLGHPARDGDVESGLECLIEDATTGDVYMLRETVDISEPEPPQLDAAEQAEADAISKADAALDAFSNGVEPRNAAATFSGVRGVGRRALLGLDAQTDHPSWHSIILKVDLEETDYGVVDECPSEFGFQGASKGFEGAAAVRGKDGVLYILGLCEGNHCAEGTQGKDKGHGKVVVMARADGSGDFPGGAAFGCHWRTVAVLDLPAEAHFQDYSAISLHRASQTVAISSQENSQVWVGKLEGGSDGAFDPAAASFPSAGGKVYDFPRNQNCEVQYCNIEGVAWVEGGGGGDDDDGGGGDDDGDGSAGGAPQVLVAVSDKMKGKGKQAASCFEKDESYHLFAIP